jgi:hypothetical protein
MAGLQYDLDGVGLARLPSPGDKGMDRDVFFSADNPDILSKGERTLRKARNSQ